MITARHSYLGRIVIRMSYNMNEMNYELEDMNVNIFNRADLNKLSIDENEDLDRFSCKGLLFYLLRSELGHDVVCDFHVVGVGSVDLFDLSTRTVYVFEPIRLIECQEKMNRNAPTTSDTECICIS